MTRRKMLRLALGASQAAMLERMGLLSVGSARAQSATAPKHFLHIHLSGGVFMPGAFSTFDAAEHNRVLRTQQGYSADQQPVWFDGSKLTNLDGTGDALSGTDKRLRFAPLWGELNQPPVYVANQQSPAMYSWVEHNLHEVVSHVSGVDAETAVHASGTVSGLCGRPGREFPNPAATAYWANEQYSNQAIPLAVIGDAVSPRSLGLPAHIAPLRADPGSLALTMTERGDLAWQGIRNHRSSRSHVNFAGAPSGTISTNPIEDFVLKATRARGGSNTGTDAYYESLYDQWSLVSKQLAADIVGVLDSTPDPLDLPTPSYSPQAAAATYFATLINGDIDSGSEWHSKLSLALKLLLTETSSAVAVKLFGPDRYYFDTHDPPPSGDQHNSHFVRVRYTMEMLGRLLGAMRNISVGPGRSLLDDTVVVVFSEFGRTWNFPLCDHWPVHDVLIAGGGVVPNLGLGGFATEGLPAGGVGYLGKPLGVREEDGSNTQRTVTNADVLRTVFELGGVPRSRSFIAGTTGSIRRLLA